MISDDIYIYTAKDHPKRGHRYGQDFKIVALYASKKVGLILKVLWGNGQKGHVRKGEFTTIHEWWRMRDEKEQTTG